MSKVYNVWVEIEEADDDEGTYENLGEPIKAGYFYTLEEAIEFQHSLEMCHKGNHS